MKKIITILLLLSISNLFADTARPDISSIKHSIQKKYGKDIPVIFSQHQKGIVNSISTTDKIIALTFDACGRTPEGLKLNTELFKYLISKNIPATLFISGL